MIITTFKRYEKKFMLTDAQYHALLPLLSSHMQPDDYCRDGQMYPIYNVYYDTDQNDLIRQSLAKPYYKEKLRLRGYDIPTSPDDRVFLELKKKIGGVVNKRRAALTLRQVHVFLENRVIPESVDAHDRQVLKELDCFLSRYTLHPAVYISYERSAWFDKEDHNLRITFDRNILTRRQDVALERGSYGEQLLSPGEILMEVKIPGAMPLWLADILSGLHIYSRGFSKYGTEYQKSFQKIRFQRAG